MTPTLTAADKPAASKAQGFLTVGGEMGALISRHDWASTPLGVQGLWPQSLRTALSICLTTPFVAAVHWGPDLSILYNDAYAPALAERHPRALGKAFRDVWPEIWDVLGPQIAQVLETGRGFSIQNQLLRMERHGRLEDTYWIYSFAPIYDETGGIGGVFVTAIDNTESVLADQVRAADTLRQRSLFAQAPGFMAILGGDQHIFEFTNKAYDQLVGRTDCFAKTVREALPDLEGQGFFELLDTVYRTGEPFVGQSLPLQVQPADGQPTRLIYVDFVYQPVLDAAGAVTGIFVEGVDVTARVAADDQQKLLVNEMNHRVKNTLSTVQALAMLTGKSAKTVAEFKVTLSNRIAAMAKTQDLLISGHSQPVEVRSVIEAELAPYLIGEQLQFACDDMTIDPQNAVRLGLLVHELLTNAAKYGALSTPDGKLVVRCERASGGALLIWREAFETAAPITLGGGFGTVLVERLAREMNGSSRVMAVTEGLEAMVIFALDDN